MVLKAASVRKWAWFGVMTLLCAVLAYTQATQPKQPPQQGAFDAETASRLLLQLNEALQGHSQKQFLALFDLTRMKDGPLFKQQITSFFSQTDSIRVHLNLSETAQDGDRATMAVEAEMEAQPSNGSPAARRNERLNFVVANAGTSWKFVDLQPRSFFSLP
jgi:hypothetical protein